MGTTQPITKGNKNTNSSRRLRRGSGRGGRLFSFGACFGLSSPKKQHRKNLYHEPVPSAAAAPAHAHGDGVESVKYGSKKPDFSKSDIPTSESIKEIQIIAATAAVTEAPPSLIHQVNNKIDQELITEEKNNKNQQKQSIPGKVQETSSNPMIKLRQSVSLPALPAPPQRRLKKGKTAAAATTGEGGNGDETTVAAGKVDSMVGASMIALTLVVMLIWGKVCAILCSAAWIFFVHCFKQSSKSFEHRNVVVSSDHHILDLDSHEYKKRVVLQGFLERM